LVLDDSTILLAPAYKCNGILKKFSEDGTLIQDVEAVEKVPEGL